MIVRWGLHELDGVLAEAGIERPFLVGSERWSSLDLPAAARWTEIPSDRIAAPDGVDGILAVGGGSAIDSAKYASSQSGLPLVSVPTTYSGAEWAPTFGIRSPDRRIQGSGGGANLAGIIYDTNLTIGLPRAESGGTALNALAHCAEALYVKGKNSDADREALEGTRLIAMALPAVLHDGGDHDHRTFLLQGAMHGGAALAGAGLGLAHAIAQALGGTFGLPHGAMNALALPPALRFNAEVVPAEVARFGSCLGDADPAGRVEQLARMSGFERLRDFGVPEGELGAVAEAVAKRTGNQANPRVATSGEIEELLRGIW